MQIRFQKRGLPPKIKISKNVILNVIRTFGNNTLNVFSKFNFVPIPKATSINKFAVKFSKTAVPDKVKT